MPNVMAAHWNIGGALCKSSVIPFLVQRRKVLMTPAAGEQGWKNHDFIKSKNKIL